MENGRAAANSELFGRLAPRTNALIRPRSVVKAQFACHIHLLAWQTEPFRSLLRYPFVFLSISLLLVLVISKILHVKVAVAPVLTHFDKQL